MKDWTIKQELATLIYEPENFAIDLRSICGKADVKAVLKNLEREDFATPQILSEARQMLHAYVVWLQGQERVKRLRHS